MRKMHIGSTTTVTRARACHISDTDGSRAARIQRGLIAEGSDVMETKRVCRHYRTQISCSGVFVPPKASELCISRHTQAQLIGAKPRGSGHPGTIDGTHPHAFDKMGHALNDWHSAEANRRPRFTEARVQTL